MECPICRMETDKITNGEWRDGTSWDCPNCGRYDISGTASACLNSLGPVTLAALSHGVWCGQQHQTDEPFQVTSTVVEASQHEQLPTPTEQLDRLVLWIGNTLNSPGKELDVLGGTLRAKIGALDTDTERYILTYANRLGLVECNSTVARKYLLRLSLKGWRQYEEIQRGNVVSRTAFMAMSFGNAELKSLVDDEFRPAVEETGFRLNCVNDEPVAGVIDDKIRVDIRLSRFLIADLTDSNNGAYWEAGYAEGLGKPVIYTCSKARWDEGKTHFDTNHCHTVIWDPAAPERASEALKATIRNTFPFEAKMPKD